MSVVRPSFDLAVLLAAVNATDHDATADGYSADRKSSGVPRAGVETETSSVAMGRSDAEAYLDRFSMRWDRPWTVSPPPLTAT